MGRLEADELTDAGHTALRLSWRNEVASRRPWQLSSSDKEKLRKTSTVWHRNARMRYQMGKGLWDNDNDYTMR